MCLQAFFSRKFPLEKLSESHTSKVFQCSNFYLPMRLIHPFPTRVSFSRHQHYSGPAWRKQPLRPLFTWLFTPSRAEPPPDYWRSPTGGEVHGPAFVTRAAGSSRSSNFEEDRACESHRNPGPSKRTTRRIMPGSSGMQASGAAGKAHSPAVPSRPVPSSDSIELVQPSRHGGTHSMPKFASLLFQFDLEAIL